MTELKPCPKCGGDACERIGDGHALTICGVQGYPPLGTIIACKKCGYHTNAYNGDYSRAYDEWDKLCEAKKWTTQAK